MSLLSLPTEILQQILAHIPSYVPEGPSNRESTAGPIIELDPNLRSLCATSRDLRTIFLPSLYDTIGILLYLPDLTSKCAQVVTLFNQTDPAVLRLIRLVALVQCFIATTRIGKILNSFAIDASF